MRPGVKNAATLAASALDCQFRLQSYSVVSHKQPKLASTSQKATRNKRPDITMSEGDKRHGDPEHGGLTSGEKSAISRAVKEGREIHFTDKHPEHAQAAEEFRKEVSGAVEEWWGCTG